MELEGPRHGRVRIIWNTLKGIKRPPLVCGYGLECGRIVAKDKEEMGGGVNSRVFFPFVSLPLALGIGFFHLQPASWAPPAALSPPSHLISQEAIGFLS